MEPGFARKLEDAWSALSAHHDRTPSIGVILGSGLGAFAEKAGGVEVPFSSIPGFPRPTVAGHAGLIKLGRTVAVMAGRIHYYEGHSIDDVVLPVFLLHRFGVRTLIVTNASGGVNRAYAPGDLVLISDHVNFMGVNPLRGPHPRPRAAISRHDRSLRSGPSLPRARGIRRRRWRKACMRRLRVLPTRRPRRSACSPPSASTWWECPRCRR